MHVRALHDRLVAWRLPIAFALLAHFVLVHYFVLGFVSWDGFGHRVPPVVELVQNGTLGREKYANWALEGFRPFIELTHLPFLAAFGMAGVHFGFALLLFPFCLYAIWRFTCDVTGDRVAAFYAAAVYLLTPMVNAQLSSGYVDWAVSGLLAYFLHALLAAGTGATPRARALGWARVALGAFLFSMSRQQAPYLAVFFFVVAVATSHLRKNSGWRPAIEEPRRLAGTTGAFLVGLAPAAILHLHTYLAHGSPIHPYKFQLLGLELGNGYNLQNSPWVFGLAEYTPAAMGKAALHAWVVPEGWPAHFFDGRDFGVGLFFLTAVLLVPLYWKRTNLRTRVLLVSFVFACLVAKDFWNPRFAYALVLGVCVCNGLAVSAVLERPRLAPVYLGFVAVLALHVARPEWEAWRIRSGEPYTRMNIAGRDTFMPGGLEIMLYPDMNADLVIAFAPSNNFILPLYGRRLTNHVVGSVPTDRIGASCEGLRAHERPGKELLVVDDDDLTKACPRSCAASQKGRCLAWKLADQNLK